VQDGPVLALPVPDVPPLSVAPPVEPPEPVEPPADGPPFSPARTHTSSMQLRELSLQPPSAQGQPRVPSSQSSSAVLTQDELARRANAQKLKGTSRSRTERIVLLRVMVGLHDQAALRFSEAIVNS
jgi:hypothetical protein